MKITKMEYKSQICFGIPRYVIESCGVDYWMFRMIGCSDLITIDRLKDHLINQAIEYCKNNMSELLIYNEEGMIEENILFDFD